MFNEQPASKIARYSDIFDRTLDPILLLDGDEFSILDANEAAGTFFQCPSPALAGHKLTRWITSEKLREYEQALRIANRRFYPTRLELWWGLPDSSTRITKTSLCQIGLSDGRYVLQVMLTDITAQYQAETLNKDYLRELRQTEEQIELLANYDSLTGLLNHQRFRESLETVIDVSAEQEDPFSLLLIDIDDFRIYNDSHGHSAGDNLLASLAKVLTESCGPTELLARYGGEEFAVICHGASAERGLRFAEKLIDAVAAHPFAFPEKQPHGKITISLGLAQFPAHGDSVDGMLRAAESALYEAKEAGRNRVAISAT
ncbi:MAG: diguanylate cyclase [Proteobacteria bacterium]|nr:MAG: diguanylate cyclase [Pseudomonadota bacterium]